MPMMVTSDMDVLSFCDGFNNHHIGTLRCRQEGASTPSTEPWFGIEVGLADNMKIGMVFVGVSLVRGYLLRRLFEWVRDRSAR